MIKKVLFHIKNESSKKSDLNLLFKDFLFNLNQMILPVQFQFSIQQDQDVISYFENYIAIKHRFERFQNRLFITTLDHLKTDEFNILIGIFDQRSLNTNATKSNSYEDIETFVFSDRYKGFYQIACHLLLLLDNQFDFLKLNFKKGVAYLNDFSIYDFNHSLLLKDVDHDESFTKSISLLFNQVKLNHETSLYKSLFDGMYPFIKLYQSSHHLSEISNFNQSDVNKITHQMAKYIENIPYDIDDDKQNEKEFLYNEIVNVEHIFNYSFSITYLFFNRLIYRRKYQSALNLALLHQEHMHQRNQVQVFNLEAKVMLAIGYLYTYELYQAEQLLSQVYLEISNNEEIDFSYKKALLIKCKYHLAIIYTFNFDFEQANIYVEDILKDIDFAHFTDTFEGIYYKVSVHHLKSKTYLYQKDENKSLEYLLKAQVLLDDSIHIRSDFIHLLRFKTSLHLGFLKTHFNDDDQAKNLFESAKTTLLPLFKKDRHLYDLMISKYHLMYSKLYLLRDQNELAYKYANQAYQILSNFKNNDFISSFIDYLNAIKYKAESFFESHQDGLALLNYKRLEKIVKNSNHKENLKLYPLIALYCSRLGHLYDTNRRYLNMARFYFEQAVSYYETLKQVSNFFIYDYFTALQDLARFENQQEHLETALAYYDELLNQNIFENTNSFFWIFNIAETYTEAGDVAFDLGNDYLSLSYYEKALNFFDKLYKINASEYVSSYLNAIQMTASLYQVINEYEKAITQLEQATLICDDLFLEDESTAKSHLIIISKSKAYNYLLIDNLEQAKVNYEYAIHLWKTFSKYDTLADFDVKETIQQLLSVYQLLNDQDGIKEMIQLAKSISLKQRFD
jgi:hypothetical protein